MVLPDWIDCGSIYLTVPLPDSPCVLIVQVNVKRLINEIYSGQQYGTPPTTPPPSRPASKLGHKKTGSGLEGVDVKAFFEGRMMADLFKIHKRDRSGSGLVAKDDHKANESGDERGR